MSEKTESVGDLRVAAEKALLKAIRATASHAASDIASADTGCQWADASLRLGKALESINTWASG